MDHEKKSYFKSNKFLILASLLVIGIVISGFVAMVIPRSSTESSLNPQFWTPEFTKVEHVIIEMPEGKIRLPGKNIATWLRETDFNLDQNQEAKESIQDFDIYIEDKGTTPVLYSYYFNDGAPRLMVKTPKGLQYHTFSKEQYKRLYLQIMTSSYYEPN